MRQNGILQRSGKYSRLKENNPLKTYPTFWHLHLL